MKVSWRRLRAVAHKELLHIMRDPRSLIMALAVPLAMLLMFGFALTLDVDRIPLLVLDRDQTPASRELISRFDGSRYFSIVGYADGYHTIENWIDQDEALAALVVLPGYAREVLANRSARVQFLLDGSDSNTASIALGYARGIFAAHEQEMRDRAFERRAGEEMRPPLEARPRVWYNAELKSRNYIVPGLLAMILMVIAALLTSLTIAREWDLGTMEQLLSTPVRPAEIVLGKLSAFFLLGAADTVIAVVTALAVFQTPLRGSIWFLGITSGIFLFAALCWGLLISSIARTQLLAFQMGILSSFLPSFLLSGFVYSIENMPVVIQYVSRIVLARYFITTLKGVFLKGLGWSILWPEVLLLVIFALVVFAITTKRLSQKLA